MLRRAPAVHCGPAEAAATAVLFDWTALVPDPLSRYSSPAVSSPASNGVQQSTATCAGEGKPEYSTLSWIFRDASAPAQGRQPLYWGVMEWAKYCSRRAPNVPTPARRGQRNTASAIPLGRSAWKVAAPTAFACHGLSLSCAQNCRRTWRPSSRPSRNAPAGPIGRAVDLIFPADYVRRADGVHRPDGIHLYARAVQRWARPTPSACK